MNKPPAVVEADITLYYDHPLSIDDRKAILEATSRLLRRRGFFLTTSTIGVNLDKAKVRVAYCE